MILKTSNGAIFIQKDNGRPVFVGCVDLDALTEPGGEIDTLIRCFNPSGYGWIVKSTTIAPPEPVTTSISTFIEGIQNAFDLIGGSNANLFIHQREAGRADAFLNFVRSWVLGSIRIGERTASDLYTREDDNFSLVSYAISALPPVYRILQKTIVRKTTVETNSITSVIFTDSCKTGYAGCKAGSGATADVLYTIDYGATWAATATDPFSTNENIAAIGVFLAARSTTRVMVALGTTRAGSPMAIAYSDDAGATWTSVNVGSVNGQYAQNHNSLFCLNPYNIWLVCGNGYIYKSIDAGLTWTAQDAGIATSNALYAVRFVSATVGAAVGANGAVLTTGDSGNTWTLRTAPAATTLNTVAVIDENTLWTGGVNGLLYYSNDGGATWAQRLFAGSGNGEIRTIRFRSGLFGYMVVNFASGGAVYVTIDGGFDWELQGTPANAGLQDIYMCDPNNAWIAGDAYNGNGIFLSVQPGVNLMPMPSTAAAVIGGSGYMFDFSDSNSSIYLSLLGGI